MDAQNHLGLRCISLVEVEIKVEETFMAGLEVRCTGDAHCIIKILEVDIEITLTVERTLVTIPEVVKDIGITTMVTGGTITEVKVMIGIEVDH